MPPLVALIELPLNGGGVLPINGNILTPFSLNNIKGIVGRKVAN